MTERALARYEKAIQQAEPRFLEIVKAAGSPVVFPKEAMFALQAIQASEYLQACSPESVFNAVINVASVGLTLSPSHKLAYLVPRKRQCCLDISYRGLKKIAEDTGSVATAVAEVVRENDEFEWFDKLTKPKHRFDPFADLAHRGEVRGVYCIAVLPSGILQVEAMSHEEIEKIRAKSEARKGPWLDWWEEMAKKSVVKRASKMWPHSERMATAVDILDQHQGLPPDDRLDAPAMPGPEAAGDAIEGESRREPEAPPPDKPEQPPERADPNAGKPMLEGQLKILRAKLKGKKIDEATAAQEFGPVEKWKFGDFGRIQKWIADAK